MYIFRYIIGIIFIFVTVACGIYFQADQFSIFTNACIVYFLYSIWTEVADI